MRLVLLLSLFVCLRYHHTSVKVTVPDKMMYCGIELTLTEGAQEKIQQHVKKLYENPRYFNLAVEKAETYMPFIEEAFEDAGIPDDIKYLAIQESNMQADAVSSANAVGFWQFKADPGREMGLRIDSLIDERKHIFRASQAAANFLNKANADFNNWLYAVVAYYEGLTGAVQHTNPEYYGKKQMIIDENLHWYAMRALAYKIAYEEALRISSSPKNWLEPQLATGPTTLKELAQKYNVKEDELFRANSWMIGKRIPTETSATIYLPKTGGYTMHKNDPAKSLVKVKPAPTPVTPTVTSPTPVIAKVDTPKNVATPKEVLPMPTPTASTVVANKPLPNFTPLTEKSPALSPLNLPPSAIAMYEIDAEPMYDVEFTIYDGAKLLADLALVYKKKYADLLYWNNLRPGVEPKINSLIYLVKPQKAEYHIVKPGESLKSIASFHHKSVNKIRHKNRMEKESNLLYEGQKLYIKHARPKSEKIIVLSGKYLEAEKPKTGGEDINVLTSTETTAYPPKQETTEEETAMPTPTAQPETLLTSPVVAPETTATTFTPPPAETLSVWINYIVQPSESLWGIATKFGTKVEIVKKANNLTGDVLSPGQILKIYAKSSKSNQPNATPIPAVQTISYTVQKGDNLNKISQKYGTTLEAIMKQNNLTSSSIREGQILNITVKNGE